MNSLHFLDMGEYFLSHVREIFYYNLFKCIHRPFLFFFWSEVAQSCPTLCDPMDCSLPGSPSMRFSRQEYWSRLPFPSPEDLLLRPPVIQILVCMMSYTSMRLSSFLFILYSTSWKLFPPFYIPVHLSILLSVILMLILVHFSSQLLCCSSLLICSLLLVKYFLYLLDPCLHFISKILDESFLLPLLWIIFQIGCLFPLHLFGLVVQGLV